jgi:hypothetical protein
MGTGVLPVLVKWPGHEYDKSSEASGEVNSTSLFCVHSPLRLHDREAIAASIFSTDDSPTLKMEAVGLSETLAILYQTSRREIPQDRNFYSHRRESLKSRNFLVFWVKFFAV